MEDFPGNVHEKSKKIPICPGKSREKSRKILLKFKEDFDFSGKIRGNPSDNLGEFPANSCGNHRKLLGKTSEIHGKYLVNSREILGISLRESFENPMKFIHQCIHPSSFIRVEGFIFSEGIDD